MIAAHLVHPDDIHVTWKDIAGLDDVISELRETVILPVQRRELFENSRLSTAPKGSFLVKGGSVFHISISNVRIFINECLSFCTGVIFSEKNFLDFISYRCTSAWPPWLRKNPDSQSDGQRVWNELHQLRRFALNRQMVRGKSEVSGCCFQSSDEITTLYYLHRRDRFFSTC